MILKCQYIEIKRYFDIKDEINIWNRNDSAVQLIRNITDEWNSENYDKTGVEMNVQR